MEVEANKGLFIETRCDLLYHRQWLELCVGDDVLKTKNNKRPVACCGVMNVTDINGYGMVQCSQKYEYRRQLFPQVFLENKLNDGNLNGGRFLQDFGVPPKYNICAGTGNVALHST